MTPLALASGLRGLRSPAENDVYEKPILARLGLRPSAWSDAFVSGIKP